MKSLLDEAKSMPYNSFEYLDEEDIKKAKYFVIINSVLYYLMKKKIGCIYFGQLTLARD